MIKTVLFDLDGTLLPMDQDVFTKAYFGALVKRIASRGYSPDKLVESIWLGTKNMIKNDGRNTNEEVFWQTFRSIHGDAAMADYPYFEEFYISDFDKVKESCGYNPMANEVVLKLKNRGIRVALATNPLFPKIATEKRVKWAGIDIDNFELYTTYENSRFCKPNIKYYQEILSVLNINPEETLMVGNDVSDDMVVEKLGMKVFLLTDNLINKDGKDISCYPNGSFAELLQYFDKNI
jgi:FMN phosphatase YigB (HAD superfamily)